MATIIVNPGESIQNAVNSLPIEGGIIELASGTWNLTSVTLVNTANVEIKGQGINSTILQMTTPETPIFAIHLECLPGYSGIPREIPNIEHIMNFTLHDLQMIGTGTGTNIRLQRAIEGVNSSNVTIYNVKISNYYGGIILLGSKDNTSSANSVHIHNINVHDCITETIGAEAMYIQFATGGTIENNTLYGGTVAISMNSYDHDFIIQNNDIRTSSIGITLYSYSNNNIVRNNRIDITNAISGIRLYAGTAGSIVENNIVFSNGIHAWREFGILINLAPSSSDGVIIRNNILYNNKYGIWGDTQNESSYNATIQIYNNVIFNNSKDGIYLPFLYNNFIIKNNIIINNKGYGINVANASKIQENYNDIYNNTLGNYNNIITGINDISTDPLFNDLLTKDFHLKSQYGRYDTITKTWINDTVTSPCIQSGDPTSDNSFSPWGGIIEMGIYGNTSESSNYTIVDCPPPICTFNITQI